MTYIDTLRRRATTTAERTVSSHDMCRLAGITYRQLDLWTTAGRLRPVDANPGIGYQRRYPASELEVATWVARFIAVGFTTAAAHDHARNVVDGRVELGDGLVLLAPGGKP
jgi:DNA-binding transcriptional MerR regulator